jgi:hypothetical protein
VTAVDLPAVVAHAVDQAALGASAPALLLEAQAHLGLLSARASALTNRGVRPFRPDGEWSRALGQLAFTVYNLADQTGVDLAAAIQAVAADYAAAAQRSEPNGGWPFPAE